ncbi:MAG: ABC transporter substrate-binding protein [SAR324 cluster bacterium]|nr:ABC transporter substrate-binding protein [SAR324 cluster bacterium]
MKNQLILIILLLLGSIPAIATPGIQKQSIVLGSHQPLTGPAASFADISKSAEAYFQYINDQGGVHGRFLNYQYEDDGFQPARTKEVVRRLILQNNALLIFNGLGTATHAAVAPWLQSLKIPDFFIGSSDGQWTEPVKKTIFGYHPTPRIEGVVLGKYLLQSGAESPIVVWYHNRPPMRQATKHLASLLHQNNIALQQIAHPSTEIDWLPTIEQIKSLNAKTIVLFTSQRPATFFLQEAHKHKLPSRIFLGHDLADSHFMQKVGKEAMEGIFVLTSYPLASQTEHPGIQRHRTILKEYAPELEMNRWTIYGQAAAELMVEILHRSGRDITRISVIETAEQLNNWQGNLLPPVTMTPQNHQAITQLRISQVQSGKFEIISDWIDSQ